jgi:hypothetical protein
MARLLTWLRTNVDGFFVLVSALAVGLPAATDVARAAIEPEDAAG